MKVTRTRCLATSAPAPPRLVGKGYSPLALVLPMEPSPAALISPSLAMGANVTVALASGLPLSVITPETGTIFGAASPQPRTGGSAAPISQCAFIAEHPLDPYPTRTGSQGARQFVPPLAPGRAS